MHGTLYDPRAAGTPSAAISSVLSVDDDPLLRNILKTFFASLNIPDIFSASDGNEALELIDRHQNIDFVLCDLNMPNLDGIEFLRLLANRNFSGAIAILSGTDKSLIALAERLAKTHNLKIVGGFEQAVKL